VTTNQPLIPEICPNVTSGTHGFLALCRAVVYYEEDYCGRGEMENRIKEQQLHLYADRTSGP